MIGLERGGVSMLVSFAYSMMHMAEIMSTSQCFTNEYG